LVDWSKVRRFMKDDEVLAFVSFPDIKNTKDLERICDWFRENKPEGYRFVIGNGFTVLSKKDVEALKASIDRVLSDEVV